MFLARVVVFGALLPLAIRFYGGATFCPRVRGVIFGVRSRAPQITATGLRMVHSAGDTGSPAGLRRGRCDSRSAMLVTTAIRVILR